MEAKKEGGLYVTFLFVPDGVHGSEVLEEEIAEDCEPPDDWGEPEDCELPDDWEDPEDPCEEEPAQRLAAHAVVVD